MFNSVIPERLMFSSHIQPFVVYKKGLALVVKKRIN